MRLLLYLRFWCEQALTFCSFSLDLSVTRSPPGPQGGGVGKFLQEKKELNLLFINAAAKTRASALGSQLNIQSFGLQTNKNTNLNITVFSYNFTMN